MYMSQLYQLIENIIKKSIKTYSEKIINEYDNVCEKKLEELWKKTLVDVDKTKKDVVKLDNEKKKLEKDGQNNKTEKNKLEKDNRKCPYEFSRGKRKGEICNVKLNVSKDFCSSHSKSEASNLALVIFRIVSFRIKGASPLQINIFILVTTKQQ